MEICWRRETLLLITEGEEKVTLLFLRRRETGDRQLR